MEFSERIFFLIPLLWFSFVFLANWAVGRLFLKRWYRDLAEAKRRSHNASWNAFWYRIKADDLRKRIEFAENPCRNPMALIIAAALAIFGLCGLLGIIRAGPEMPKWTTARPSAPPEFLTPRAPLIWERHPNPQVTQSPPLQRNPSNTGHMSERAGREARSKGGNK